MKSTVYDIGELKNKRNEIRDTIQAVRAEAQTLRLKKQIIRMAKTLDHEVKRLEFLRETFTDESPKTEKVPPSYITDED